MARRKKRESGGIDLTGRITREQAQQFAGILKGCEPFDATQFVHDLAAAREAWERGERGKGIRARIEEMQGGA